MSDPDLHPHNSLAPEPIRHRLLTDTIGAVVKEPKEALLDGRIQERSGRC